jgi:hypothetical protein
MAMILQIKNRYSLNPCPHTHKYIKVFKKIPSYVIINPWLRSQYIDYEKAWGQKSLAQS